MAQRSKPRPFSPETEIDYRHLKNEAYNVCGQMKSEQDRLVNFFFHHSNANEHTQSLLSPMTSPLKAPPLVDEEEVPDIEKLFHMEEYDELFDVLD